MEHGLFTDDHGHEDMCERCMGDRFGRWYIDEHEGGSEWFLCDACANAIRAKRGQTAAERAELKRAEMEV